MRILILILTLSFLLSCNSKEESSAKESLTNNEVSAAKKHREIESFVMFNGVITDTIFEDELSEKIMVKNYEVLDGELFICYSRYKVEEPLREDLSFYSKGNHIAQSTDLNLREKIGKLIDASSVEMKKTISLSSSCSHDDKINFDKITPGELLYAAVPICSETYYHQIFSEQDSTYVLEFEFESCDSWLDFKFTNDSTITAAYTGSTETGFEKLNFKHVFQNK